MGEPPEACLEYWSYKGGCNVGISATKEKSWKNTKADSVLYPGVVLFMERSTCMREFGWWRHCIAWRLGFAFWSTGYRLDCVGESWMFTGDA